jgi:hypothetical protein
MSVEGRRRGVSGSSYARLGRTRGEGGRDKECGRTDENSSDVHSEGAVARTGDVLDEEGENGFEGEIVAVGEGNGKSVAADEFFHEGESGGGSHILRDWSVSL